MVCSARRGHHGSALKRADAASKETVDTMARLRFLTVQFIDGTSRRFSFPEQADGAGVRQIKLASFFEDRQLIIESEAGLNVFPFENLKAVQLSSESGELDGVQIPPHAIRGATELT